MEALFTLLASNIALGCEFAAIVALAVGAAEAVVGLVRSIPRWGDLRVKKAVWVRFAAWILLGLEFTLAADIVRTALTPTWSQIGQLAAIAAIRTVLNLFLERDVEAFVRDQASGEPAPKALV